MNSSRLDNFRPVPGGPTLREIEEISFEISTVSSSATKTHETAKNELQTPDEKPKKEAKIKTGAAKNWIRLVNPETETSTHSEENEADGIEIKTAPKSSSRVDTKELLIEASPLATALTIMALTPYIPYVAALGLVPPLLMAHRLKTMKNEGSSNREVSVKAKRIEAKAVEETGQKTLPNQKLNPHLQLAIKEFARFFAPTIGSAAEVIETALNNFWSCSNWFLGRKELASRPERIKQTGGAPVVPSILEVLDNGLGTGAVEAFIQTPKPKILELLEGSERRLFTVFDAKVKKEVKASETPVAASETPKVEEFDNTRFSSFKKAAHKVIHIATVIFAFISKASHVLGRIFIKVEVVKDLRTDEQKKTDEAMHKCIHQPIKEFLEKLHKMTERAPALLHRTLVAIEDKLGQMAGDKLINMMAIRLSVFRNLFGQQNQERVSRLYDHIIDNVLNAFGTRLGCINNYYYANRNGGGVVNWASSKIANIYGHERQKPEVIASIVESQIINQIKTQFPVNKESRVKTAETAMITLTEEEAHIYAHRESIEREFGQVLADQMRCYENINALKRTENANVIELLEKESLALSAKNEKLTSEFKMLKNIEQRMDKAEKEYLKHLSNKIIDRLFPEGIPFYWNVTVLLPDFVQIGFNVLSFFSNSDPKENLAQTDRARVKLLQEVGVKYLKSNKTFGAKAPFRQVEDLKLEDALPLVQTVFSRNVWFKCQGAREYLSELLASALSIALNFGLNFGAFMGTPELDKLMKQLDKQISDGVDQITFIQGKQPYLRSTVFYLLDLLFHLLADPEDKGDMLKERLAMTRVNKYVVFSMLDAAISVCEREAANTLIGKSEINLNEKEAINKLLGKSDIGEPEKKAINKLLVKSPIDETEKNAIDQLLVRTDIHVSEKGAINKLLGKQEPLSPPPPANNVVYPINDAVNFAVEFGACALNSAKKAAPHVWNKVKNGAIWVIDNTPALN